MESDSELEKALLGFKGGYGGQSLSSLMKLIALERLKAQRELVRELWNMRNLDLSIVFIDKKTDLDAQIATITGGEK